ncbi:MAG: hypothetical protein COT73_00860 [Bdellovibrio sp. CG10_big_fil_rev_8_21_14_0_10_47_8]|nr:MAG: hypothetical protein COT73_00860 [Bdellovibrio sp. CG10_big_fil_rev_8_21_14_0_10_47_8]
MKRFKQILVLILLLTPGLLLAKTPSPKFPRVEALVGQVEKLDDVITVQKREAKHQSKKNALRKKQILKDRAQIMTGSKSELRLQLADGSVLVVLENSEILIPGIGWRLGETAEIEVLKGKVRYLCQKDCGRKLITEIYESVLPVGDYVLSYDPSVPRVELTVLSGESPFRARERDESVTLHAGERAHFDGVLSDGAPTFDILLRGRKVAQGKLSELEKVPEKELKDWAQHEEKLKKKESLAAEKKKKARKPSQICNKPWGELNQCQWTPQKNGNCLRQRCNANGEWAEDTELTGGENKCQNKTVVAPCDY